MIDLMMIDSCKNPNVDTAVIQQIIQVESSHNPLILHVNKVGMVQEKTKQKAKEQAQFYISQGYNVDIGLMQINSNNLNSPLFKHYNLEDMFDSCKNIKVGSDIFYLAYEKTNQNLPKEERMKKALSIYNTGNENYGFKNGYVEKYSSFFNKLPNISKLAKQSQTKVKLDFNLYSLQNNKYFKSKKK